MQKVIYHLIATIKYRFDYAIEGANNEYWKMNIGHGVRTPLEILYHMRGLMYYAEKVITGRRTPMEDMSQVKEELDLFYQSMDQLKKSVAFKELSNDDYLRMMQGPLSDALTHVGQLAMMRRLNNQPVDKQNFMKAKIGR